MSHGYLLSVGSNARGQLATGNLDDCNVFTPASFPSCLPGWLPDSSQRIVQLVCGSNHTLLLIECKDAASTMRHQLWGCGDGSKGQLSPTYSCAVKASGASTSVFRQIHLKLEGDLAGHCYRLIAASWETTYIVLSRPNNSDVVISLGSNDFGNLGVGDASKVKKPSCGYHRINFDFITSRVDVLPHSLVVHCLSAGARHVTLVVSITLKGGTQETFLLGWGAARHGQLGEFRGTGRPVPFYSSPRIIPLPRASDPVVEVALGNHHTVLLHCSGHLSGLGANRKNQLDGIADLTNVKAVGCTWNGTYAMTEDRGVFCLITWGDHAKGQLGQEVKGDPSSSPPPPVQFPFASSTHHFVKMACGSEHVLALFAVTADRPSEGSPESDAVTCSEVWGWGWNEHGNLGIGNTQDVYHPIKIWPRSPTDNRIAVDIWAGCGTSWMALAR